jgi:hypothetical protein
VHRMQLRLRTLQPHDETVRDDLPRWPRLLRGAVPKVLRELRPVFGSPRYRHRLLPHGKKRRRPRLLRYNRLCQSQGGSAQLRFMPAHMQGHGDMH